MPEEHKEIKPEEASGVTYRSFLLRCWQEEVDGKPVWRFTLVQMDDEGIKKGFASLDEMFTYIRDKLDPNG
jgi:hypothetical protein